MRSFVTLLAIEECIDWCHIQIKWNRKVGPVDLQTIYFSEHLILFVFVKIRKSHPEFSDWVSSIFGCSKHHHLWLSIFFCFRTNISFSGHFSKFQNRFSVYNLFYLNESLYEPFRQWLGWQFTGGPKWCFRWHWGAEVSGAWPLRNWFLKIFLQFVLS